MPYTTRTWADGNTFNAAAANDWETRIAAIVSSRGKSIIATTESRTNVAYGKLTTPDQVSGVVLPTDGLLAIAYHATWQNSVSSAGFAAIFIGATQLKNTPASGTTPVVQEASLGAASAGFDAPLVSHPDGLFGTFNGSGAYVGDVTTGQTVGVPGLSGPCYVFAAAGTYDISVQFKASSGSVTAKNRKLWVWTIGF